MSRPMTLRWRSLLAAGVMAFGLAGCVGVYKGTGVSINSGTRLDDTPRIAVISAFEPELKPVSYTHLTLPTICSV